MDCAIVVTSTDEDELVDIETDDVTIENNDITIKSNDITIETDDVIINNGEIITESNVNHKTSHHKAINSNVTNSPFKRTKTDKLLKSPKVDDATHESDLTKWWKSASEFRRPNAVGSDIGDDSAESTGSLELHPMLQEPAISKQPLNGVESEEANLDNEVYYDEFGEIFSPPTKERVLSLDVISEKERELFPEFFSGQTKYCPRKYLNIRNAILNLWNANKPSHVNKVMLRPVLKKGCGNVNNIGRIHRYLESIGAINYGSDLVWWKKQKKRQKQDKSDPVRLHRHSALDTDYKLKRALEQRMSGRSRKRPAPFTPDPSSDNLIGGYTIDHANNNQILIPPIKKETQPKPTFKKYNLVKCKEFGSEQECPYDVTVHASALVVVDVHSHLSSNEVMGLLGGYVTNGNEGKLKVDIVCAQPCKSSSSTRHCEMDSVSQAVASDCITNRGLNVIGWYHSHPTFPPQPSETDIKTQFEQQSLFSSHGSVFLGMIISSHHKHKVKSEVNILHIVGNGNQESNTPFRIPFAIDDTVPDGGSRNFLINMLSELIEDIAQESSNRLQQLLHPIVEGSNITQLDKIMRSLSSFVTSQSANKTASPQKSIGEYPSPPKHCDNLNITALTNSNSSVTSQIPHCDASQASFIFSEADDSFAISSNFSLFSDDSFGDYDVISHCDIISEVTILSPEDETRQEPVTWKSIFDKLRTLLLEANSKSLGEIT